MNVDVTPQFLVSSCDEEEAKKADQGDNTYSKNAGKVIRLNTQL
jgi:hypothetical protein